MTSLKLAPDDSRLIYNDEPEKRRIYLEGAYDMCRLLSTSPRMNRPQMKIIEEQAHRCRTRLEAIGVQFLDARP